MTLAHSILDPLAEDMVLWGNRTPEEAEEAAERIRAGLEDENELLKPASSDVPEN